MNFPYHFDESYNVIEYTHCCDDSCVDCIDAFC